MRLLVQSFVFCSIIIACSVVTGYGQTVTFSTDASYLSDTSNNQNPTSITTYNGSIYYVYTNPARQMVVGKINPAGVKQLDTVFDLEMGLDEKYHICPTIGVDKNGYIHICGDMHNDGWKYFRSNRPEDISTWTRRYDLPGLSVTYPTIFYDKNREMYLLFRHRQDGTGGGNHRAGIAKYNVESSTFTMLGGISYTEKNGTVPTTKTMAWANGWGGNDCWYIKPSHRVYFDGNNRMHFIACVINVCLGTLSSTDVYSPSLLKGGYESNTHILYAYSDDTGRTWRKAGGALISSLPLTVNNASIALDRTAQHDIIGGESELGAFNTNTPVISYRLFSDNSNHSIKWNGSNWVEFTTPRSGNLFMFRPNGYAAWYNGTRVDYTNDGVTWGTLNNIFTTLRGVNGVGATGIDREYFKQTGHFRYQGTFNSFTNSSIFTINSDIGNVGNIVPSVVSLSNTNVALTMGAVQQLTATISPTTATNKNLIWSSSDNSVVYVNGNGLLIPYKCGTATITVKTQAGNRTATATVVVSSPSNTLTGLSLSTSNLVVLKNQYKKIVPSFTPNNVCNSAIVWTSSNTNVATVDENGVVYGVSSGNATIVASNLQSGLTASCNVSVTEATNFIQNPEFDLGTTGWSLTFALGGAGTLSVVNGAGLSGSNAAKITINNAGTSTNSLRLNATSFILANGKKYELYFKAKADSNRSIIVARTQTVSPFIYYWQSSVNITTQSTLYGPFTINTGATDVPSRILFALGGKSAAVYIDSVTLTDVTENKVTNINLNKNALNLSVGATYSLFDTILPAAAFNQAVTITSNNPLVATVTPYGLVTAVGVGTATITYVSNQTGVTSTCLVTVGTPLPLNNIQLNGKIVAGSSSLTWEVIGQQEVDYFVLQRQNTNDKWESIGAVQLTKQNNSNYQLWDKQPQKKNLYRLKVVLKDGNVLYSNQVSLTLSTGISARLLPNPFKEKAVLELSDKEGIYQIQLTNVAGKVLLSGRGNNAQLNNKLAPVFHELKAGTYLLSVNGKELVTTLKLIKQ